MKSLRNSFLTLLALTLFGGAGAWAQGPTVAELPASTLSGWNQDFTPISAGDLPGFVAVDSATADQWAPTSDYAVLIYAFTTDGKAKYVVFDLGDKLTGTNLDRNTVYQVHGNSFQVFYTTGGGAIELTKSGANQWTLGQTPDYDLELQVEYYEAHALKNIPAGWQVKVNGVDKTNAIVGDSLLITETDSVTLVPTNPRRVKSVTLQNDVSYITVAGLQLIGKDGDSWATIRDNNPDKIDLVSGYVYRYTDGAELKVGEPSASCGYIDSVNSESSNYSAETESNQGYRWCQSN